MHLYPDKHGSTRGVLKKIKKKKHEAEAVLFCDEQRQYHCTQNFHGYHGFFIYINHIQQTVPRFSFLLPRLLKKFAQGNKDQTQRYL